MIEHQDTDTKVYIKNVGENTPYTVKKFIDFHFPSRDVAYQLSLPWPGITKLFPVRESLVRDIPAGDRKIENLFLQCRYEVLVPCIVDPDIWVNCYNFLHMYLLLSGLPGL
jgi:hypothetical protein